MCGIVGAASKRNVMKILLAGLKRLEYRGYDSAGMAVLNNTQLQVLRTGGKVAELEQLLSEHPLLGHLGIAHTRWATHGKPSKLNAHPLISHQQIAVVHNGIIENYRALKDKLIDLEYTFSSQTDTEVIAHLLHYNSQDTEWLTAVQRTIAELEGALALGIINTQYPDQLIAARRGSPLIIGVGIEENFIASDQLALLPYTQQFIYLEEGDIAIIAQDKITLLDQQGKPVKRPLKECHITADAVEKGPYRHFMQKEIFEQATVITNTLNGRIKEDYLRDDIIGEVDSNLLAQIQAVQIIACGTSYHAGLVAKHWLEAIAGIPTQVEVASEFRYRPTIVLPNTLFVTISQSGETADTLAALRLAKQKEYLASLAICNVPQSTLVRESDFVLQTYAGTEIGVASTKAFTTQLVVLLLLCLALNKRHTTANELESKIINQLRTLPAAIEQALTLDDEIQQLARFFIDKQHALFLGRGTQYPIALEGALKLKEISYVHAEAYPAGELKHGPLALVDNMMPVVAVAPNDNLLAKLMSNLQEVKARDGHLFVFTDQNSEIKVDQNTDVIRLPNIDDLLAPILYTIPLQLLAYHVAVLKGTDVDQPRNLAKAVTVE